MPVFKPRNRLVNFRLSEEEFNRLQAGCRLNGARSLSDYARSCVLRDLAPDASAQESGARQEFVQQINHKVETLESRVQDLLHLVDSLRQQSIFSHSTTPVG